MEDESIEILIDLLKLYKKYGNDAIDRVRQLLRSKKFLTESIEILEEMPEIDRRIMRYQTKSRSLNSIENRRKPTTFKRNNETQSASKNVYKELEKLKEEFPQRYNVLNEAYSRLKSGALLPKMSDIRNFAKENHINETIGNDRRSSIRLLMIFLIKSKNSMEDLDRLIKEMVKFTSIGDTSTLQRWANIIMRDKEQDDKRDRE